MSVLREIATEEAKLEMTPMIDVTFLLLIFFMCTLEFKSLEGKLEAFLPKREGIITTSAPAPEALEIRVEVTRPGQRVEPGTTRAWSGAGEFDLVGHEVAYRLGRQDYPGTAAGRAALLATMAAALAVQPDRGVKLVPGPGTLHDDVMQVLDEFAGAGHERVTIAGSRGL